MDFSPISKGHQKIHIQISLKLERLIPGYLKNRQKDIDNLIEFLKQEDFDKIKIIGHNIKGSGSGYGFKYLTEVGHELEKSHIYRNSSTVQNLIEELSEYLDNIEITYI